jgi:hypothetical protein
LLETLPDVELDPVLYSRELRESVHALLTENDNPPGNSKSPYESEPYQQTTVAGTKEKSPMLSSTDARQPLEMDGWSHCRYGC